MESVQPTNKGSLLVKFFIIYVLSIALVGFLLYNYFKSTVANSPSVMVDENASTPNSDFNNDYTLQMAGTLNNGYKQLKALDQSYQNSIIDSASVTERENINRSITDAEISFYKTVDSVDRIAMQSPVPAEKQFLGALTEAYRAMITDRNALKKLQTSLSTKQTTGGNQQQAFYKLQGEIQARDSRIAALENSLRSLQNKSTVAATKPGATNTQELNALRAQVSSQDKKIAGLTAANAALEKENNRLSSDRNDQSTKPADNTAALTSLRSQNAQLQARVNQLNAEVQFAQVDCNFSRADASQIISNSRQRKSLLGNALGTLKTLSASDDPTVKKKATDKINQLNQIASTIRD